jgi:ribonuclease HI
MLKHLPESALETLLAIFNDTWLTGNFPPGWSQATIIPIPKPGKGSTDPGNYRPIALTSCLCKTFERLVNDRLVWYLETNNILTEYQSGFRKQRSTIDHLVRLESFIREAFVRREHVVSVFFDLEKAYDTTWKYGILRDLHEAGLRGRLPEFISNFLANRLFRVRVGSCLSDAYNQEMGVPQGSILSVTLFILKINSIIKCLPAGVRCSLYVDDFLICYRSKSMHLIERQLQRCLNNIQHWADENGFQFSKTKTVCMHFCHQYTLHPDPDLNLNGSTIPVVEQTKFLGLIFDRKLTFIPHIKYLKDRCLKAMNLLRVVAHTDWGANTATLLKLYRSHLRSKLDYGSVVYGSARSSYLQSLDRVQNAALRVCLGAFRTSPISSLHVEANEMPLSLRRQQLSLQYMLKLKSNRSNPAHKCVFEPDCKVLFDVKPTVIPTLGLRMHQQLLDLKVNLDNVAEYRLPSTPFWLLKQPVFVYSLHNVGNKADTPAYLFCARLNEILSDFDGFERVYTDGSKDGTAVAAAAVCAGRVFVKRLPENSSIYSAEARAILLALDIICQSGSKQFLILSDSLSCLQSIENRRFENPLILEICVRIHKLLSRDRELVLVWLPSHVGSVGNAAVDAAAKTALNLPVSNLKVPYTDFISVIRRVGSSR